jgi:uncharacterized alkaline shock family protein YloU
MNSELGMSGKSRISCRVLASIARAAAAEAQGIAKNQPIKISINGPLVRATGNNNPFITDLSGPIKIDLKVALQIDCSIPASAKDIQKAVKESLQNSTGILVSEINVTIERVVF